MAWKGNLLPEKSGEFSSFLRRYFATHLKKSDLINFYSLKKQCSKNSRYSGTGFVYSLDNKKYSL